MFKLFKSKKKLIQEYEDEIKELKSLVDFWKQEDERHGREIKRLEEKVDDERIYASNVRQTLIKTEREVSRYKLISKALEEFGVSEIRGELANSKILEYFKATKTPYDSDEIAWCSAFMNYIVKAAGMQPTGSCAAKSWKNWGHKVELKDMRLGDIVVFNNKSNPQGWQGHVALAIRADGDYIYVLGGNQGNQVKISAYEKSLINTIRRPL